MGRKATGLNPKLKIQGIWRQGCLTDLSHPPFISIKSPLYYNPLFIILLFFKSAIKKEEYQ